MRNLTRPWQGLPLLIVAVLVPGCSPAAPAAAPAHAVSGVPKKSASPAPRATTGSDVQPCRYADCEIVIHGAADISLDPKFGVLKFSVSYARPDQVTIEVDRLKPKDVHALIQGTGYLSLASGLTVIVENFNASGAVLRFSPTTPNMNTSSPTVTDKNNDKGSGTDGFFLSSSPS